MHSDPTACATPMRSVLPDWLRLSAVWAALALLPSLASAHEIGHTQRIFVDPARGDREIPSEIFYPAAVGGEDVPLAPPPPAGFPVVSFGHGYLIPWSDYEFFWEGLVPAGYIVVLPDTEGTLFPSHGDLGLDLAFVIAALRTAGGDPGSPFYQGVAQTAAVCGHSMGGGATFLAAAADPSISTLASFAAAETNPSAIAAAASITAPALIFSGSHDCVTPPQDHQLPMYDALASDCRAWVNLLGASHCQFAEYNFTCELGEFACEDPAISRDEQHALSLELLRPYLAAVLSGDEVAWQQFLARLEQPDRIEYLLDCDAGSVDEPDTPSRPIAGLGLRICPNPAIGRLEAWVAPTGGAPWRTEILSASGRRVCRLRAAEGAGSTGEQRLTWSGRDDAGLGLPAGVYLLRVTTPHASQTRRFLWIGAGHSP